MEITEVRIKLVNDPHQRLLAFCSITLDECFVVRDLKIIQGTKGAFVAMPSRKLTDHCPRCQSKNHLRSRFCSECGARLDENRALSGDGDGRAKLYADIAHPINSECREAMQDRVLSEFAEERIRADQPGYVCTYDDYGEDRIAALNATEDEEHAFTPPPRFESSDDRKHRVEPAAKRTTPPPHHAPTGESRTREKQSVGNGHHDDGFGEGLV